MTESSESQLAAAEGPHRKFEREEDAGDLLVRRARPDARAVPGECEVLDVVLEVRSRVLLQSLLRQVQLQTFSGLKVPLNMHEARLFCHQSRAMLAD